MNIKEIPDTFIDSYILSIKTSVLKKMKRLDFYDEIFSQVLQDYFSESFETEKAKTKLYNYYYDIKHKWKNTIQNYLDDECIDFDKIDKWKDNKKSYAFNFPHIESLSFRTKKKATYQDLLQYLIMYIDNNYSGSKDMIFIKSTDLILSGVFGMGTKANDIINNDRYQVNNEIQINESTDKVVLFTEEDAKIINTVYQMCFNQLLKSTEVYVNISDLTYIIYGNRATKNKERITTRLTYMNRYRTTGKYLDENGILIERFITFVPDISIIHKKSKIAVINYSETLRRTFLNNVIIEENNLLSLPAKSKEDLTYLMHEIIKKVRIEHHLEASHSNNPLSDYFEYRLSFNRLKELLNINDDTNTRDNIKSALIKIKENTSKILDFEFEGPDYILKIGALTQAESNYISRIKNDIKNIDIN